MRAQSHGLVGGAAASRLELEDTPNPRLVDVPLPPSTDASAAVAPPSVRAMPPQPAEAPRTTIV
jgi:hypothetical protein